MKLNSKIMIIVFCIFLAGCNENVKEQPDKSIINSEIIKTYNDMALENAIISQHTLYPYHFVKNGAQLNELGKRDLNVLIKYFITEPGYLNIRKSETPSELYENRVGLVYQRFMEAGLDMDRIKISDEMPGGEGMESENIIVILNQDNTITASPN